MNENETITVGRNGSLPTILPNEAQGESQAFKVTKICFYFIILSASTFGNSMLAHVINITRKMHTASNFLILNLAICDLVTPLISIVFDFILEENNYQWIYGSVMCRILWPTQTYFTCASSLTLAAISLDRYRIILHPFKPRLESKQICLLICLVHLCSLVAVTPYGYFLVLRNGSCEENWPEVTYRQAYTFSLFLIQYALPLLMMVFMYSMAVRALCNTSARTRENSIVGNTPHSLVRKIKLEAKQQKKQRGVSKTHHTFIKRLGRLRNRDIWNTPNAKATKMFIVIVTVFAIFMFPNQVVWLWADFGGGNNPANFSKLSIICWLFTYTNSVVNPVIFGVFSKDFRKGFKRIFKSILCYERSAVKKDMERLQCQSTTKTGSESMESSGVDSKPTRQDENLNFPVHLEQKIAGLDVTPNKQSHEMSTPSAHPTSASTDFSSCGFVLPKTTMDSFSNKPPLQTLTRVLTSFEPEGEKSHFNGHIRTNSVGQWITTSNVVSYIEILTDALNSSPETNC